MASLEDRIAPNALAAAARIRARRPEVLEVFFRLGDLGDHQRIEVLVIVTDEAVVDRAFRHVLKEEFAELGRDPMFDLMNVPPWPLLHMARASERAETLEAAGSTWRIPTTS